jgi:hypothetical protein
MGVYKKNQHNLIMHVIHGRSIYNAKSRVEYNPLEISWCLQLYLCTDRRNQPAGS